MIDSSQAGVMAPRVASLTKEICSSPIPFSRKDKMMIPQQQQKQLLVRFQNVTRVIHLPASLSSPSMSAQEEWILKECATHYHWPLSHLRIQQHTQWNNDDTCQSTATTSPSFVTIQTISSIRGGKGGFGTLLKGQARQAGATLTTDFGACRDLQGRRLRHVNDEIKLRKWREKQQRQANGEKKEDNDDDLYNTESGLYNWHLMTPTWADISKKATRQIRRQFQQLDRKEETKRLKRKEQEDLQQNTMAYYVEQTEQASQAVTSKVGDALKQGLLMNQEKKSNKRQRLLTDSTTTAAATSSTDASSWQDQDRPSSLCTLSGNMIVSTENDNDKDGTEGMVRIQSQSEFATAVLVLDYPNDAKKKQDAVTYYYEVSVVTGGLAQIGWASLTGDVIFQPNDSMGDGVGDDAASFAIDGSRGRAFHNGTDREYSACVWKAGDRIGCLWNQQTGEISYTLNGKSIGDGEAAFTATSLPSLMPAVSCNQGQILELYTTAKSCKYYQTTKKNGNSMVCVGTLLETKESASSTTTAAKKAPSLETKKPPPSKSKPTPKAVQVPKEAPAKPVAVNKPVIIPKLLDLTSFDSVPALEALGLARLKSALMALQVKCGGTLSERATRLLSLKGMERKDYPPKVKAKGFRL